jgi:hypothetical protein
MRKVWASVTLVAALCFTAAAFANGGAPPGKRPQKGAPVRITFTVTTADNGTCESQWATAVVRRTYVVKDNGDGTFTLTRYDRGRFVTTGRVSPGACDPTGRHGHKIRPGVKGRLVGYLRGTITGGMFDANATCTGARCGETPTFLETFFGANATWSCQTDSTDCAFNFDYVASLGQSLRFRHWQDKGKGAGTQLDEQFIGDIAAA